MHFPGVTGTVLRYQAQGLFQPLASPCRALTCPPKPHSVPLLPCRAMRARGNIWLPLDFGLRAHRLPRGSGLVGRQPEGRATNARHATVPPSPCTAAPLSFPRGDLQSGEICNLRSFACARPANAGGHVLARVGISATQPS